MNFVCSSSLNLTEFDRNISGLLKRWSLILSISMAMPYRKETMSSAGFEADHMKGRYVQSGSDISTQKPGRLTRFTNVLWVPRYKKLLQTSSEQKSDP